MMKTYLTVYLHTEGSNFSEVADILEDLGFRAVKGRYDFVYDWDKKTTIKDIAWFGDKIHMSLRGKKVYFRIESVDEEPTEEEEYL